jgi:hypothetical protein
MRVCRLYGFRDGTTMDGLALRIDRAAERDAVPVVTFEDDKDIVASGTLGIAADGREIARLTPGRGLRVDRRRLVVEDRPARDAILAALRRMQVLQVQWSNRATVLGTVSLDGAPAALLFADDRQRRVGTVTALVNPGTRPAAAVPEVPARLTPLSTATAPFRDPPRVVPRGLEEMVARDSVCELATRTLTADDIALYRLGDRTLLVGVRCWRAAYNTGTAWYIAREGGAVERAPILVPFTIRSAADSPSNQHNPAHILTNSEYDGTTRTLTHFHKGRGVGDCGMSAMWRWDGMRFQTVSASYMPACRHLGFADWMVLYRSP